MVVVAYGLILPQAVLDIPRLGCLNVHASLLPRWRGAAPIQYAIAAGDCQTGISIMRMERGLDTGPVYMQRELAIAAEDTSASLHDKLALLGAQCLLECVQSLQQGALPEPIAQDERHATHAPRLQKADARIDWQESAEVIARKVRAYNPWPAAWTELLGKRTVIWEAQALNGDYGSIGKIIEARRDRLLIACGSGALAIRLLQPAGSRAMPVSDWLNAYGRHFETTLN
jgi:methionyl-tRNA formyltransferase